MKKSVRISEQAEALALDLFRQGLRCEQIAEKINRTPLQTRRIISRLLESTWELRYPGLAGLPLRLASLLIHAGIYTKKEAAEMIRSGAALCYNGIGPKALAELCEWCGIRLIECHAGGHYWVEGQVDLHELRSELEEKISVAQQNILAWQQALSQLQSWEPWVRRPHRSGSPPPLDPNDPED